MTKETKDVLKQVWKIKLRYYKKADRFFKRYRTLHEKAGKVCRKGEVLITKADDFWTGSVKALCGDIPVKSKVISLRKPWRNVIDGVRFNP